MNPWQQLPQPFFILAPMEAVTDVVFRHVVAEAGAPDVWFSEFTNATGWVHAGEKAIGGRLVKTGDEHPIIAQIWGGEPGDMEQLAAHCRKLGYDGIDINMGCPAKSAVKSGGSALIRQPELAANAVATAKTAGLPVSVKTRLGYTRVDEWRDWLTHLLRQDIVNLTIHLRTKKEMSKVPAHHELIDEIIALRDEIAPQTLLTINGDILDRAHGLKLVEQHPGINGIMIGRGVFQNPFCFAPIATQRTAHSHDETSAAPLFPDDDQEITGAKPLRREDEAEASGLLMSPSQDESNAKPSEESASNDASGTKDRNNQLINLLHRHLDLYDQYAEQTGRPYDTLKRFYKIYVRDFDGASALRDKLMHTKNTDEVRTLLTNFTD